MLVDGQGDSDHLPVYRLAIRGKVSLFMGRNERESSLSKLELFMLSAGVKSSSVNRKIPYAWNPEIALSIFLTWSYVNLTISASYEDILPSNSEFLIFDFRNAFQWRVYTFINAVKHVSSSGCNVTCHPSK